MRNFAILFLSFLLRFEFRPGKIHVYREVAFCYWIPSIFRVKQSKLSRSSRAD